MGELAKRLYGEVKQNVYINPPDYIKSLGKGFLYGYGDLGMYAGKKTSNSLREILGKPPLTDYEVNNDYGKFLGLPEQNVAFKTGKLLGETFPFATIGLTKTIPYFPYLNGIWQGRNLLFHKPFGLMSRDEVKQYGRLGNKYYQNFLQNNPLNKNGFGLIEFGSKNNGKDLTINMERYPFLRKNLSQSVEKLPPTNYKNEHDRIYRYLENNDGGSLYYYLIEDIEDKGLKYKMMKNKTRGE